MNRWLTITNKKGEEYSVKIVFTIEGKLSYSSGCDCRYGSFHRWTEENKKDKWMCRHIVKAYAKIIKLSPKKAREILIKQGICNKEHLKKI